MATTEEMRELFATKAKAGDGAFAVAWALLAMADAQVGTAAALHRLGIGNANTQYGAIESLGMQVEKVAEALNGVAGSINEHGADWDGKS